VTVSCETSADIRPTGRCIPEVGNAHCALSLGLIAPAHCQDVVWMCPPCPAGDEVIAAAVSAYPNTQNEEKTQRHSSVGSRFEARTVKRIACHTGRVLPRAKEA
jgi:hypothetical protein